MVGGNRRIDRTIRQDRERAWLCSYVNVGKDDYSRIVPSALRIRKFEMAGRKWQAEFLLARGPVKGEYQRSGWTAKNTRSSTGDYLGTLNSAVRADGEIFVHHAAEIMTPNLLLGSSVDLDE